ncbi:MAG TPA: sialate O-acetylesterase [Luteolibacter sp.]|nr:sialate O-acetylesterase [Luteolibacter sp.]
MKNPIASGLILLATLITSFAQPKPVRGEELILTPAVGKGLYLHNLFQSNMILQRQKPIRIWGWSDAGDAVKVSFGGQEGSGKAAADGRWEVVLKPMEANSEGQTLKVRGGKGEIVLENILIGDLWLLGGQSNMEFSISKVENGELEVVAANYPKIRLFSVPSLANGKPKANFPILYEWSDWSKTHFLKGLWEECTPKSVTEMSAIGYIFGRRLHMASGVPIGLVDASVGGTSVEAWTPLDALRKIDDPEVKEMLAAEDAKVAEWDPAAALAAQVKKYESKVEQLKKDGKEVPESLKRPTDAGEGPAANRNYPGNCYLGLIAPLRGLEIKGAIFHQGYNNCFNGSKGIRIYAKAFPEMIRGWRDTFNDPALPFGIMSLCTEGTLQTEDNYLEMMANPGPELREVQYRTFLNLQQAGDKNIGYCSTFDLHRRWYHPQLKIPAGERIARWALATQYGMKLEWEPAKIVGVTAKDDGTLQLKFDKPVAPVDDGSGVIKGFAISGEDRHYQLAKAEFLVTGKDAKGGNQYDNTVIVLSSPLVAKPLYYRHAWGRNPLTNLQLSRNTDVPVATQRNETWDMGEVPIKPEAVIPRAQAVEIRKALQAEDLKRRIYEAKELLKQTEK